MSEDVGPHSQGDSGGWGGIPGSSSCRKESQGKSLVLVTHKIFLEFLNADTLPQTHQLEFHLAPRRTLCSRRRTQTKKVNHRFRLRFAFWKDTKRTDVCDPSGCVRSGGLPPPVAVTQ